MTQEIINALKAAVTMGYSGRRAGLTLEEVLAKVDQATMELGFGIKNG